MKKIITILLILMLTVCTACNGSVKNTVGTDYETIPTSDLSSIQSEIQGSTAKEVSSKEAISSKTISSNATAKTASTISKSEALTIAKDIIKHYQTYENVGIACDFDYNVSSADYDALWNMLSEDQRGYLEEPYKCKCCKTYNQALQHLHKYVDSSLIDYVSKDYVVYKGNLYFFMGAKGSISYQNIKWRHLNSLPLRIHYFERGVNKKYRAQCG